MNYKSMLDILTAFERYINFMCEHNCDVKVKSVQDNATSVIIAVSQHMKDYEFEVYFSGTTGELCIDDPCSNVSIFDFGPDELESATEEEIRYIKYGKGEGR